MDYTFKQRKLLAKRYNARLNKYSPNEREEIVARLKNAGVPMTSAHNIATKGINKEVYNILEDTIQTQRSIKAETQDATTATKAEEQDVDVELDNYLDTYYEDLEEQYKSIFEDLVDRFWERYYDTHGSLDSGNREDNVVSANFNNLTSEQKSKLQRKISGEGGWASRMREGTMSINEIKSAVRTLSSYKGLSTKNAKKNANERKTGDRRYGTALF